MKRTIRLAFLGGIVITGYPAQALSQDLCRDVLLYSRTERATASSLSQSMAFAEKVDEGNYEQVRRSVSAEATLLTPAVAGWFKGGYEGFREKRSRAKRETGYSYSSEESQRLVESFMPPEAVAAWAECIRTRASRDGRAGVEALVYGQSADQTTVRVQFRSRLVGSDTRRRVLRSVLEGVSQNPLDPTAQPGELLKRGRWLGPTWTEDVLFHRNRCQPFNLQLVLENSQPILISLPWTTDVPLRTHAVELRPKEQIFVAETDDWSGELSFTGLWNQGIKTQPDGSEWIGPFGRLDDTEFNLPGIGRLRCKSHAVIYQFRSTQGQPTSPWTCYGGIGTVPPHTRIYAQMHDTNLGDNVQGDPPMTATLVRLPPIPAAQVCKP